MKGKLGNYDAIWKMLTSEKINLPMRPLYDGC